MTATSLSLAAWRDDLRRAAAFLTRLPLAEARPLTQAELQRALRAFPLIGLGIGACGALAYALAWWLGLPPWPAAFLALLVLLLAGGALHEDGLADMADSLGARGGRAARLAVLRDSRVGAFSVLALVLAVGLKASALAVLAEPGKVAAALLAAQAASRALLPLAMHLGRPARREGLGAAMGRPGAAPVAAALLLGLLALLLPGWGAALLALVLLPTLAGAWLWLAERLYGGYTGDVLGALQQVAEILILLLCVVMTT